MIKLDDFIKLGWDPACGIKPINFIDYLKYLLDSNFAELEQLLKLNMGDKCLPNRSEEEIIEGALANSPQNLKKKKKEKNYYHCHARCLMDTIKRIFNVKLYNAISSPMVPQLAINNYQHILQHFLFDSTELYMLYLENMKDITLAHRPILTNRQIHYLSMHQILRQSIFGQCSYHSFVNLEISSSIAIIRQIVEFRIRRAFGVIAFIDSSGNLQPLGMSALFACLEEFENDIVFPIKLSSIIRIYQWSNMYIHSGEGDFSWLPFHLEFVLRNFSFGHEQKDGYDVKNSIKTNKKTIENIHCKLLNGKSNLFIYSCEPECILT